MDMNDVGIGEENMNDGYQRMQQGVGIFEIQGWQALDLQPFIPGHSPGNIVTASVNGNVISLFSQTGIEVFTMMLDTAPCCRNAPETGYGNFCHGMSKWVEGEHGYFQSAMSWVMVSSILKR